VILFLKLLSITLKKNIRCVASQLS